MKKEDGSQCARAIFPLEMFEDDRASIRIPVPVPPNTSCVGKHNGGELQGGLKAATLVSGG